MALFSAEKGTEKGSGVFVRGEKTRVVCLEKEKRPWGNYLP
jgi:hypothetical protein